jgi:transposase-like protein
MILKPRKSGCPNCKSHDLTYHAWIKDCFICHDCGGIYVLKKGKWIREGENLAVIKQLKNM